MELNVRWTRWLPAACMAVLPLAGCAADAGEPRWRGTVHGEGAAVEVRNPEAPVFGDGVATAEPLWTVAPAAGGGGGEPGDWARPIRLALGPGEVYVLDQVAGTVHMVSRAGHPLRRVGRAGKGPGELESPFGLAFVDGKLAVGDGRGVELFSPAGEPAGAVKLNTVAVSLAGVEPGGLLVKTFRGEQRVYPLDGGAPVVLPARRREGKPDEVDCSRLWGAGGQVVRLDCTRPVFEVISRDGALLRTVRTPREPVAATSAELAVYRRSLAVDMGGAGLPVALARSLFDDLLKAQSPKRLMRGIRYDPAAGVYAVWEQQPQELGNGPARLHLFSRAGMFLTTVRFADPWVDFAMEGRTVYALAEDPETGLVRLAAYRVGLPPEVEKVAAAPLEPGRS